MTTDRAKAHEAAEFEAAARAGMVPPRRMWTMVGGADNFVEQGRDFSDFLIEHGGVTPASTVLDIGCGLGKHAIHLAEYLKPDGRYEGFDVEPLSIEWCQRAITTRHPHVRFRHVAVQSRMYYPDGAGQASKFKFPYGDDRFDLAFLASVFTHMFHDDVRNYIGEIARVLKPGGKCIATGYLLNENCRQGIADGTSAFTFSIPHSQDCWFEQPDPPEAAVAHEEGNYVADVAEAGSAC